MTQPAKKSYRRFEEEKVQSEFVRNKLKLKGLEARRSLFEKYPHVEKFFAEKGLDLSRIREHSAKILATSALTGTLLFAPPSMVKSVPALASIVKNLSDFEGANAGGSATGNTSFLAPADFASKGWPDEYISRKNFGAGF